MALVNKFGMMELVILESGITIKLMVMVYFIMFMAIFIRVDWSKYEGQYQKGMKNGQGIYKWPDGSVYDGQWEDNKMNDFGKYTWADGRQYEGQWMNEMMYGAGIQIWLDGIKYEQNYQFDKRNDYWIMEWKNIKVIGQMVNNMVKVK